jgi:hypothetical protein
MNKFSEAYEAAQKVVKNEKFPADWESVIKEAQSLLAGADGPAAAKATAVDALRKKILDGAAAKTGTKGKAASEQILEASKEPAKIAVKRAATLKMLKHLYLVGEDAGQQLWVYSPPKAYTKWVFEEFDGLSEATMKTRLEDEGELYSVEHRKVMAAAALQARKVCGKVQAELGAKPGKGETGSKAKELVQKWFFGEEAASKEDLEAAITKLRDGFKSIAVACGGGGMIFSDEPTYRALPGKWQNFGMIRPNEKMMTIYLMKGFLDEAGKSQPAERWLCVETIIHELSHKVIKTDDYAYDFHGLKPGGTKFPAGAGLDNADSWGYFACEVDGILPSKEEAKVYKVPSKVLKVWSK